MQSEEAAKPDFPGYLVALAEVLTVRSCIPKTPKFIHSEEQIVNASFMTMAADPENLYRREKDRLQQVRKENFELLGIRSP